MAAPEAESALGAQMREMRAQLQALREKREHIELQTLLVKEKQRLAEEEKQLREATDKLNATIGSSVAGGQQNHAVPPASRDTSSMVAAFIESVRSPNAENPTHANGHTHNAIPVNGSTKNGTRIQAGTVPHPGNTSQAPTPSPAPTKVIPRYEVWKQKVEQERALAAATAAAKKVNGAVTALNGASAPLANQPTGKRPGEGTDMSPAKIQKQNPPPPQVGNQQPQVGKKPQQMAKKSPQTGNKPQQMVNKPPQVGNQQPQVGSQPQQPQTSSTSALSDAEKRLEQRLQRLPVEQPNEQIKASAPPTELRERSPPRYSRARSPSRPARGYSPPGSMRGRSPFGYRTRSPSRHRARSPSRPGRARSPPRGYRTRSPSRRRRTRSPPRDRFRSPPASYHSPPRRERSPPRAHRERTPPTVPRAHTPAPPNQNQNIQHGSPVTPFQKPQVPPVRTPPKPPVPTYGASHWQECRNFTSSVELHFQRFSSYYCNDETKVETAKLVIAESLVDRWNAYVEKLPRATWLTFCTFLVELLPPDKTEEECRRIYSSMKQRPSQSVRDFVLCLLRYHKYWNCDNHNRLRHLWDRIVEPLKNTSTKSWKDFQDFHEFVEHLEGVEEFMKDHGISFGEGVPKPTRSIPVGPSKRGRGGADRGRGGTDRGRGGGDRGRGGGDRGRGGSDRGRGDRGRGKRGGRG